MKLMGMTASAIALSFAAVAAVGAFAQQSESKSKVTVKDGKSIDVTGCLEPSSRENTYMLTHVADKKGALHSYILVADDVDFAKHVGHRVQVSGKAADRGDAKVEVETKTKTTDAKGDDKTTHTKSTVEGDISGVPYLGVESLKMVAAVCP